MRWLLQFCATVLISIAVGYLAERMADPASIRSLQALQRQAFDATSEFDPWELSRSVMAASGAPSHWVSASGPDTKSKVWLDKESAERTLRSLSRPLGAANCIGEFRSILCPRPTEPTSGVLNPNRDPLSSLRLVPMNTRTVLPPPLPPAPAPPAFAGWAGAMPIAYLKPIFAVGDVLFHLPFAGTWMHTVVILLEVLVGLGLFAWWTRTVDDAGFLHWAFGLPIVVVVGGSLCALAGQWLMLGGLVVFGQLTSLAGLCCGAGGVISTIWFLLTKSLEVRVSDALTGSVKKL